MLVVLGLISDMNDSTQSTIYIPQLYVLHSRAVLALRLCMRVPFKMYVLIPGMGLVFKAIFGTVEPLEFEQRPHSYIPWAYYIYNSYINHY